MNIYHDNCCYSYKYSHEMNIKAIIALCGVAILTVSVNGNELTGCVAKQFVEHKTRGLIHCKFPQDFNSVYWYDVDNSDAKPVLMYDRTTKTVTPEQGIPRIDNCSTTGELCILQGITSRDKLTCTVHGAKPWITLSWSVMIGNVEKALHAHAMIKPSTDWNVTFHSTAVLDLANVTTGGLNLFICSSKLEQIDHRKYSKVLVDMLQVDVVKDKTYIDVFRERDKRVELRCSSGKADNIYVWKKILSHTIELVSYGLDYDMVVAKRLQERYEVKADKTLYIDSAQVEDEGKFICISSDGINHYVAAMNLIVLVPPSPSYLIIDECTTGNCIITSNGTDSLTCSVTGLRPPVNLKWNAEEETNLIIKNQVQSSVQTMELHDIKSILYFDTSNIVCGDTVKVTCEATGAATQLFRSLTEVRIKVIQNCTEESIQSTNQRKNKYLSHILTVLASLFPVTVIVVIVVRDVYTALFFHVVTIWQNRAKKSNAEMEMNNLINTRDVTRNKFIEQIQTSYRETVFNSPSAHYVPNRLNVLPFSRQLGQVTINPKILDSFEKIFTDPDIRDKHVLIEGRSGIGKTALVLHMMENWLLCKDDSPLIEYDMIIVLPLKNINDINLNSAIIKYLLPEDGGWKEETVQDICQTEKKVLAIFDDFDQYSKLENSNAEVNKMLSKKIRQIGRSLYYANQWSTIN
ncbi:hypothetical protein BSL78_08246 [Apostichopus japonicus]|uniref:Ig-like domain-containing protein n=1 Tax=Stichopus japonicus TaxID=307972 RepID=A0A2G8L3I4_STIJA|nr:hypothetical protein BSL78_08246 [Apostichopus japonicus]